MTDWPKISIVIPNYNGGETLGETLQSIVSQNYPCLEIIVVDGGSSDNSVDVIKQYGKDITWWVSEKDNGVYDAINKGFSKATGDIFAWLGSGDLYFPHALLTVGDVMKSLPQIQWLTTLNPAQFDHNGNSISVLKVPGYSKLSFLDGRHLLGEIGFSLFIQQESTFWKQELWEKIGGCIRKDYTLSGDFDLWARFFEHAELYGIESLLGGFRYRQKQLSTNLAVYISQSKQSLNEMRKRNHWSRNILRDIIFTFGLNWIIGRELLNKLPRQLLPYQGLKVVRENESSPNGTWTIVSHNYL